MGALPNAISVALARGATVLAANQRAARTLRRAFDATMQREGRTLWHLPEILPLETWFGSLWSGLLLAGHSDRIVLNRTQEHVLWRDALEADPALSALHSPDGLAELAARAQRALSLHGGSARAKEFGVSTDTRAFARWSMEVGRRTERERLLLRCELPAALLHALAEGTLDLPAEGVALVDFDAHPPAHAALFEAMERAGYAVETIRTGVPPETAELYAARDDRGEIRQAALWVRAQLERNPEASIAVVVPDLEPRRAELARTFAEVLAPETQHIGMPFAAAPFEFSLGRPLARTALARAGLDLLRWTGDPLSLAAIGSLLLSPFFVEPGESLAAAEFDAGEVRRAPLLRPELSLEDFLHLVEQSRRQSRLGGLVRRLRAMRHVAAGEQMLRVPGAVEGPRQTYAEWADAFRSLLEAAGLARAAASDSLAFQTFSRWESALDEMATLDFTGAPPTAAEALAALERIVEGTIFAPESRNAPVQILGPLELGGVPFDALWFVGADQLAWPPATSPQPLLPFGLQRELGLPGANQQADAAGAQALTTRLARSAPRVVFSYAREAEEGVRRPSSTLSSLSLTTFAEQAFPQLPARPYPLPHVDAEPLAALPDRVLRGGARVLQLQAACGFRAFAELRLRSADLESKDLGMDPRERGELVHRIMESFWLEVESQDGLRALPVEQRHELLDRCIDGALRKAWTRAQQGWDEAYLEVQRLRLRALLRPWLPVELDRPRFVVASNEKTLHDARIGPLRLDLRVDRIDLTAGGAVILDYKTGEAKPSEWLSDRPDAPQLPLYAVLAETDPPLGGVAFLKLRAGEDLCLEGFADSRAALAKSAKMEEATLADQVDAWGEILTRLAEDFAAGDARVLPKSYPGTCNRCSQRILCRLNPARLDVFDGEEEVVRG